MVGRASRREQPPRRSRAASAPVGGAARGRGARGRLPSANNLRAVGRLRRRRPPAAGARRAPPCVSSRRPLASTVRKKSSFSGVRFGAHRDVAGRALEAAQARRARRAASAPGPRALHRAARAIRGGVVGARLEDGRASGRGTSAWNASTKRFVSGRAEPAKKPSTKIAQRTWRPAPPGPVSKSVGSPPQPFAPRSCTGRRSGRPVVFADPRDLLRQAGLRDHVLDRERRAR